MSEYIRPDESIGYKFGRDYEGILAAIGNRFIGSNPPAPFVFRTFNTTGILCDRRGQYILNFGERFKDWQGRYAYAFGKLWSESGRTSDFSICCYGPVKVYVNKKSVHVSDDAAEGYTDKKVKIPVTLIKGWNSFLIQCERTDPGFGCLFGNAMPQWEPCNFHAPFAEREGKAGFIFTMPLKDEVFTEDNIPDLASMESSAGIKWLPDVNREEDPEGPPDGSRNDEPEDMPAVCRAFDGLSNGKVYAWTSIDINAVKTYEVTLSGEAFSPLRIWFDGEMKCIEPGSFIINAILGYGKHDILVESGCDKNNHIESNCMESGYAESSCVESNYIESDCAKDCCLENNPPDNSCLESNLSGSNRTKGGRWGFRLKAFSNGTAMRFSLPRDIKGCDDPWLYSGPFDEALNESAGDIQDLYRLFDNRGQGVYWRTGEKDTVIRPFVENALYGRWTYPLGVTLYGLLRYGEMTGNEEVLKYVKGHVGLVTKMHGYALYDKEKFGFPGINHQIAWLDALDDCGSFGSLMLECNRKWPDENSVKIASIIADHMMNRQIRREDGAFYRGNDTMWVDDLYMSVPFLRRYYQLTRNTEYLDEACRQILIFEKYLFMRDVNTMSHIFSFEHNKATNIPWSRGNGWAVFSISELLEILPAGHQEYEKITGLYNRLVSGFLKLQGEHGLWHQVLDRKDTYEESSCTAMFICAFARGIIKGYISQDLLDNTAEAAFKAWNGLAARTVDYQGNIYGVCRGSGFSFSSDYYKELSWNYNDTHGIGIIMLAGTEMIRLEAFLGRRAANE